jgi:hypothetical protein
VYLNTWRTAFRASGFQKVCVHALQRLKEDLRKASPGPIAATLPVATDLPDRVRQVVDNPSVRRSSYAGIQQ